MHISDQRIPPKLPLEIHVDVLQQRPDLAIGISLAIAGWASIESRLDAIFLFRTRDEAALAAFRAERGWDAREKFFYRSIRDSQGRVAATELRAILRVVAAPAKKRHEIAHGTWAISTELPDDLILLGGNYLLDLAKQAISAERTGAPKLRVAPSTFEESARVVSRAHLQCLYDEMSEAEGILHSYMLEKMPHIVHVHDRDKVPTARSHPKVAAKIAASINR